MNIVAVSDHVFHKFPFGFLIQVSATQLSLFLIPSVFMANDRTYEDAMHTSLPVSPTPLPSNFGSPLDLERTGSRPSTWKDKINEIYFQLPLFLQSVSRRVPRQWPLLRLRLQVLSKLLAASQSALPPWKQVQPRLQAFPAQQDHLGPHRNDPK